MATPIHGISGSLSTAQGSSWPYNSITVTWSVSATNPGSFGTASVWLEDTSTGASLWSQSITIATGGSGSHTVTGLTQSTSYTAYLYYETYNNSAVDFESLSLNSVRSTASGKPVWPAGVFANGTVGTAYSSTVSAQVYTLATSYTLKSGSLPPGLSLSTVSNAAQISGTPSTAGSYSFTLTATNSKGSTDKNFTIVIVSTEGEVGFYNGTSWVQSEVYVYNGTTWAKTPMYYYNGTSWVLTKAL